MPAWQGIDPVSVSSASSQGWRRSAFVAVAEIHGALNGDPKVAEFGPERLPGDAENPGRLPLVAPRVLENHRQEDPLNPALRLLVQTFTAGCELLADERFQVGDTTYHG